ncbi:MAG: hypothetical protein U0L49_05965 [Eubacterium sp.]|nr:hypothetical protein [Eubacterium sp.]
MNYVYRNAEESLDKFGLLTEDGHLNHAGWYLFGKGKPVTIKEGMQEKSDALGPERADIGKYRLQSATA